MNITEAMQLINYAANNAHGRYITHGFGQMMVYNEKAEEAADYIAANYPKSLNDYPLIASEVDATSKSAKSVADGIITRRGEWVHAAALIEKTRLTGKERLNGLNVDVEKIATETIKALDEI